MSTENALVRWDDKIPLPAVGTKFRGCGGELFEVRAHVDEHVVMRFRRWGDGRLEYVVVSDMPFRVGAYMAVAFFDRLVSDGVLDERGGVLDWQRHAATEEERRASTTSALRDEQS